MIWNEKCIYHVQHWPVSTARMSNEFFPYPGTMDMQYIIKSVVDLPLPLDINDIILYN